LAPHLHLLTLGAPLLVSEAGEQIRFRTRKHFALLIRLAVEAGRRFTRDHLMDLLWPNVPATRARHSLAQALSVLREKVGRDRLIVQRASIALVADAVTADVRTLENSETEIRGPFLEGFDVPGAVRFEQWKDEWRAKLMPRIRDSLVKQMDAGRRIGNFEAVERHAQVLLDLDPLSEDAVRGVMEARAWVGDRTNALKAYSRFAARLTEELDAKPSPELVRIADLLREGRSAAAREHGASHVSERRERRVEAETLIGREREFARLYDAWLEVRRREPRIVVLLGDPGVGKTTLVNAFVSTCQMEGAAVARAQAYQAERELPLAVLAELIKQLTVQRAIGGAEPEALSELTRVSPEILAAFPGVPKPVEWSAEVIPLRLADAFLKAVEAAAEESPLVLVVDDIHAADNASVAILHGVARKLPRARVLMIVTARSNELRMAEGSNALTADSAIEGLRVLELDPLPPPAAERLVTARVAKAEARVGEVPIGRIVQAGNGNPLALELLAKEWIAHGSSSLLSDLDALNTQPVANLGIPRAIGAVFERQLRRLDASTRAALDLAAVLGRRLADLPLYEVVDLSPAAAGEALSRLKEEGLLREVQGGLEFRNELIRAQAYYAVAGPARQYLHRETGKVLATRLTKSSHEGAAHLEVAWHFLRGADAAPALTLAIKGAEAAIAVGAPYEAEQVLTVLSREPCANEAGVEIRLLLAKALIEQSKASAALPTLAELLRHPGLTPREFAEATALRAAAEFLLNAEADSGYCNAADLALDAARQAANQDLVVKALFEYARSGMMAGRVERVSAVRQELESMLGPDPAIGSPLILRTLAYCSQILSDVRSAAATMERVFTSQRDSGNPSERITALASYAFSKYALCEFAAAHQLYLEALTLSKRIGDDYKASMLCGKLCGLQTSRGDYTSAIHWGSESTKYGSRAVNQPDYALSWINLADAYMLTGQRERALACWEELREWMTRPRNWQIRVTYLLEGASFELMCGNVGEALDLVASAERACQGKERAYSDTSMFIKYKVFRTAHVKGNEAAWPMALEGLERFRDSHTLYYLNTLGVVAWLERRDGGHHSGETERALELFDKLGAHGRKALLVAQGFLR
jgi:DNA-binding SARP family transcriptional activator/tetratricopeptide (TPR) repeat protein